MTPALEMSVSVIYVKYSRTLLKRALVPGLSIDLAEKQADKVSCTLAEVGPFCTRLKCNRGVHIVRPHATLRFASFLSLGLSVATQGVAVFNTVQSNARRLSPVFALVVPVWLLVPALVSWVFQ